MPIKLFPRQRVAPVSRSVLCRGLSVCTLAALGIFNLCRADDDSGDAVRADFLLRKVRFSREMLTSGECEITGTYSSQREGETVSREMKASLAFDYVTNSTVFDLVEDLDPSWTKSSTVQSSFHRSISGVHGGKSFQFCNLLKNPKFWIDFDTKVPPVSHHLESRGFDIRALGFFGSPKSSEGMDLPAVLDAFLPKVPKAPEVKVNVVRVEALDTGLAMLSVVFYDGQVRRRVWIDTANGFTAVKSDNHFGSLSAGTNEFVVEATLGSSETEWRFQAGTYVPVNFKASRWIGPFTTKQQPDYEAALNAADQDTISYSFEWQSVNEKIDSERFEYTSFNLPVGTRVWDNRVMPAEMIKVITETTGTAKVHPSRSSRGIWLFTLFGCVFLTVVAGIAISALRRNPQAD